jgi:hypothetical protein
VLNYPRRGHLEPADLISSRCITQLDIENKSLQLRQLLSKETHQELSALICILHVLPIPVFCIIPSRPLKSHSRMRSCAESTLRLLGIIKEVCKSHKKLMGKGKKLHEWSR